MHDPVACRVSGVRFRHYGYLRATDRFRKHRRYTTIDPNPDAALTGGGYAHLDVFADGTAALATTAQTPAHCQLSAPVPCTVSGSTIDCPGLSSVQFLN